MLMRGYGAHDFRDPQSGTRTLSYRVPATCTAEAVRAYYADYLRRHGYQPALAGGEHTQVYTDAPGLIEVTITVHTEALQGEYRTVIVSARPARARS